MRNYTRSLANFLCVCLILSIFSTGIHAQFKRQFGTPLDEYFSKVIQNGSQYYVLGQAELSQNQIPRATVSLINNTGELQWTLSLDIASVWNDAVLTPSGDLLVVGNTLPASSTSGSLMGLVASNGGFTWVRSYDLPEMDGFVRIVNNPVPQNSAFPYYVLGTQTDLMTFNTDMVLLNLNESGTFNWKKLYNGPIFFNGSKIPHDMEAMPNGDLLIAVNFDTQGLIMRTDNSGQGFGGVTTGFPSTFTDITKSSDGGIYAVVAGLQNGLHYMMKFDSDLIGISDVNFLGMNEVHQITEGNGDIYVCGSKGPRQTVLKFTENNNAPTLSWIKALDNGIVDQTPSTLTFLLNGQIAYADGRTVPQGGFGELCAILSISDAELTTCMTVDESGVEIVPSGILFESPLLPDVDFYDVPPATNIAASSSLNWQQDEACGEPCEASFNINFVDNCGHIQVISTSVGQQPLTYQWCSGENTPNLDVQLSCGPHTFCVSVTCADGSISTASQTINVVDNIAPLIDCPADITQLCNEGTDPTSTGFATATDNCTSIPVIAYSDQIIGNFPCEATILRSWTATDSCGNTSSCLQQITVVDNVPPSITCPANVAASANPPDCSAIVDGIRWINAGDNCGLAGIQYNITGAGGTPSTGNNNASGASFNQGTSIVTYTATDDCGNTQTCSFNVTVNCEGQNQIELNCGMAVATCFPGFNNPSDPNSQINNTAPVIGLYDIRNTSSASPGPGHNWSVPKEMFAQGNAGSIGEVFGIAIDTAGRIFTTASTIYGSASNLGAYGFQWGPGGPGGIYRFTYNSTSGQWDMDVFASLPNSGSGLGNIAYDPNKDQFFVTNHSDGLIYRIGNSVSGPGTIHTNKYDYPGVAYFPGSAGFVALGERLWGIGYNNSDNRVYFSVWNEDNSRDLVNVPNQIFSIGLDIAGEFLAFSNQRHEIDLPNYTGEIWSNPVSDIEFSNAGRMLVAEKVMLGDFGNVAAPSPGGLAHRARIFQYQGISQSWGSPMHIHIGNAQVSPSNEHNNSAGGIDYGYQDLDDFGTLEGCDSLIWGTGDALMYTGHNNNGSSSRVYGIAGMPSSGNSPVSTAPNYVESTSFYVDLDGTLGSEEKTEIGDVDIFNCVCPGVNIFCDDISVSSMSSNSLGDSCCFVLEVNNQLNNFFTGITLCSSNGVSISTISSLNGWTVAGFNSQLITVQPSTPHITSGNQTFIIFCLSNYQAVPSQQIIVKYHGPNFSVECMDTLNYECSQKPKCLKVVNDTIICNDNGQYQMDFCIMSDALIGWPVSSFELNAPAGVTFTPSVFSVIPALAPGSMRCAFSTLISGAHDGQTLCFSVTAHKQNIFNGETPLDCCTDTVMLVCVTMPSCVCNNVFATAVPAQSMGDTCCWQVSLLNNYSNSFFTGIELDIITPGVVFGAINNTLSSGWNLTYGSQNSFFHKKPPGSHIGVTDMLPTFCLSGITSGAQVPQMVVLNWLGPNSEIECTDTLIFNCEPPVETDCAALVNPVIECDSINGGYNFEFQVMNNSGFSINEIQFRLIQPPGSIFPDHVNLSSPLAHGQTSGLLSTGIFGPAGSQVCFNLTVHELGANGEELNCCTKSQQYCFILPFCDSCCADSTAFFMAAQNVQTFGTLGDCEISFAAEGLDECMQITYFWGDGPGSQSNPVTSNGVLVTHTFAGSGTYIVCYEIEEISNGHPCWSYTHCDTVDIICNSCCLDFDQFCQNVMNAVNIIVNPDSCKVTLQIGDLPECDYIEWVDWGDNMQSSGNFVAGDMPMHVYTGSGTYIISYLAIELDSSGFICFEKILKDTIFLDCDPVESSECCAYEINFINRYIDGRIKKVRLTALCDTKICCADPDEWGQNLSGSQYVEWFPADGSGIPYGTAIDNDFIIFLDKNAGMHDFQVDWFNVTDNIVCSHIISIDCAGEYSDDEDWLVYTSNTALDDPNLMVFAVREPDADDEAEDCDYFQRATCPIQYDIFCNGGNSYAVFLYGHGLYHSYQWEGIENGLPVTINNSTKTNADFIALQGGSYVITVDAKFDRNGTCSGNVEIILPEFIPDFSWQLMPCGTSVLLTPTGWSDFSAVKTITWFSTSTVPGFPITSNTAFTHLFPVPANSNVPESFPVTMVIEDIYGCTYSVKHNVIIDLNCSPSFKVDYSLCTRECGSGNILVDVNFTNTSTGGSCTSGITYHWDFGDLTSLINHEFDFNFVKPGKYLVSCPFGSSFPVTLTMTSLVNGVPCSKQITQIVNIGPCDVVISTPLVCPDGKHVFTSNVPGIWSFPGSVEIAPWPHSDKPDINGHQNFVAVRYNSGSYLVTFTGFCPNGGECTIHKELTVNKECYAVNDKVTHKYYDPTNDPPNWSIKSKLVQRQIKGIHRISALTVFRKKADRSGFSFRRRANAAEIQSLFTGKVYRSNCVVGCNYYDPDNVGADVSHTDKKRAKAKEVKIGKFKSWINSIQSTHRVKINATDPNSIYINLWLGYDCDDPKWHCPPD